LHCGEKGEINFQNEPKKYILLSFRMIHCFYLALFLMPAQITTGKPCDKWSLYDTRTNL
jgi:hypothetical protein